MQTHFAQTTLQMEDFKLSRFAYLTTNQRSTYLESATKNVTNYFDNHRDEVAVIEHFLPPYENDSLEKKSDLSQPKIMPLDLQLKLLAILENKEILTQDIFYYPEDPRKTFTEKELKTLNEVRQTEILRIRELPLVKERLPCNSSTTTIFDKLEYTASEETTSTLCHDNLPKVAPYFDSTYQPLIIDINEEKTPTHTINLKRPYS